MHFSSNAKYRRITLGFTLVEMLIIAPIVILMIGAFVSAMVAMTGEVIATRAENVAAYDTQSSLDQMDQDIKLSGGFLANNDFPLQSPQGYNDGSGTNASFENVSSANGTMLILRSYTTNKNPLDPTRGLVYTNQPSDSCDPTVLATNQPFTQNIIYFIKNNTLWRRTLIQQGSTVPPLCSTPWQLPSCTPGIAHASGCKVNDQRMIDNVSAFTVQYYPDASTTNEDLTASDMGSSDTTRGNSLTHDNTVSITLTTQQTAAGRNVAYSGSLSATKQNSAIASAPLQAPPAPVVSGNVVGTAQAQFTWSAIDGVSSYNTSYNINGGAWTTPSSTTATSTTITANMGDMVNIQVNAVNSAGQSPYGTASVQIPRWVSLALQNNWSYYGSGYTTPAWTKTSAGVIILKGMIARTGTAVYNETIASLPAGYQPSEQLLFQTTTNSNAASRVDVFPDGTIHGVVTNAGWLSLDNISFLPANTPYSFTSIPLSSGWSYYGSPYAKPAYATDSVGRIFLKGLLKGGTGPSMGTMPTAIRPAQDTYLPEDAGNAFGDISLSASDGYILPVTTSTSFTSIQATYYPASFSGWNNLTLQNGWVYYSPYTKPQYFKAADGVVTLQGMIKSGTMGAVIGTLPVGDRPSERLLIATTSWDAQGRVDIMPDGTIVAMAGSNGWFAINGINFIAEQ